jgi:hypothetical protein
MLQYDSIYILPHTPTAHPLLPELLAVVLSVATWYRQTACQHYNMSVNKLHTQVALQLYTAGVILR